MDDRPDINLEVVRQVRYFRSLRRECDSIGTK